MRKLRRINLLLLVCLTVSTASLSAPRIVQTRLAVFPKTGNVIIQAREEIGQNPRLVEFNLN